jgi:hypothetical protein
MTIGQQAAPPPTICPDRAAQNVQFERLYWAIRAGIAMLWTWTAFISWYVYPKSESLDLLRQAGVTHGALAVLGIACVLDLAMGILSCVFAIRLLWQAQFLVVASYTLIVAIGMPHFLLHPFQPITKNFAVLACLAFLILMERRRRE